MAKIILNNLTKKFKYNLIAVNKIFLEINNTEFFVIVGPSGCGKTTILRIIAGLEKPTEGEIYSDGTLINNIPVQDRNVAMVFQNYSLYPHMSIKKNLAFGLRMRKVPRKEISKRIDEVTNILEIKHLVNKKPRRLSGGELQRIALGRAIVRKPNLFLFDEPLSNLDLPLRMQMRSEIAKLHRKLKSTVIYVTHDQMEAMNLGQRIAVMNEGEILQVGTPAEIYNSPNCKFVGGFFGTPPMNFFDCRLSKAEDKLYCAGKDFKFPLKKETETNLVKYIDKEITIGIRPEDLQIRDFPQPQDRYITGITELYEHTGAKALLHVRTKSKEVVAKIDSNIKIDLNKETELNIDVDKLFFFDKNNEARIMT